MLEVFETVKQRIEETGLIEKQYTDGTCFCVVGHIMDVCGVDMNEIKEKYNKEKMYKLPATLLEPVYKQGFSLDQLEFFIQVNDQYANDKEYQKFIILTMINDSIMIERWKLKDN